MVMQNMNGIAANDATAPRELSLDEAEMVGGGFGPIGQIIITGLGGATGVGVVAGGKILGGKLKGLLGNGGGKHVPTKSSGKGGGKHVRPSGNSKSSIAGWGDGFGGLI
jgi:hypothetical protein